VRYYFQKDLTVVVIVKIFITRR